MIVTSLDQLDLPLAWRRVGYWASTKQIETTDRLPFELVRQLRGGRPPTISRDHHVAPVDVVFGSKHDGLFRPFSRLAPSDLMLYQALVDVLAPDFEAALAPATSVMAYRQSLTPTEDTFAGAARWNDFAHAAVEHAEAADVKFLLKTDIAGYFLNLELRALERRLRRLTAAHDVVDDLLSLLNSWNALGVRGLPQGVEPSSVLGNVYLTCLDEYLEAQGVRYLRWMDDLLVFTSEFHEARAIQEELERRLYDEGLSLASGKTHIVGAPDVADHIQTREAGIERHREHALAGIYRWIESYGTVDEDDEEIDRAATQHMAIDLFSSVDDESLPDRFSDDMRVLLRRLARIEEVAGIRQVPQMLLRAPDLFPAAMRYLHFAGEQAPLDVAWALHELLDDERHLRHLDLLHISRASLSLPAGSDPELADRIANRAIRSGPPALVEARAILAWGKLSELTDFSEVDQYWTRARAAWRPYALVAIQDKAPEPRNERLASWGGRGRFLGDLGSHLQRGQRFKWSKL